MPINKNYIIVWDSETVGLNTELHDPTQIAAISYDARTLKEVDRFNARCCPETPVEQYESKALEITRQTKEMILSYPPLKQVFSTFASWLQKYSLGGRFDQKPIPAGHNIINYDMKIFSRLCKKYGYCDKNGEQNLFGRMIQLDTIHLTFYWFESNNELERYSFDELRKYLGIELDGAHEAMKDVEDTGAYLIRFMKWQRDLAKTAKFKNSFKTPSENTEKVLTSS